MFNYCNCERQTSNYLSNIARWVGIVDFIANFVEDIAILSIIVIIIYTFWGITLFFTSTIETLVNLFTWWLADACVIDKVNNNKHW